MALRHLDGFGYRLQLADIVRFGRIRFKVVYIYGKKDLHGVLIADGPSGAIEPIVSEDSDSEAVLEVTDAESSYIDSDVSNDSEMQRALFRSMEPQEPM